MLVVCKSRLMIWALDRPEHSNGFDESTMAEMDVAIGKLEEGATDLSCLLIRGDETVFSTGLDAELLEICFQDRAKFTDIVRRMGGLLDRLAALPMVTIACVDGDCRLGGLELALACDLIIAGPNARITDGHLAFDAMPGGGATKRLPLRLGYSGALHFLLESPVLDGREALDIGLVDKVAANNANELGSEIAHIVTERDPVLMRSIKASLRAACPAPDDRSFFQAFQCSVIDRLIPG